MTLQQQLCAKLWHIPKLSVKKNREAQCKHAESEHICAKVRKKRSTSGSNKFTSNMCFTTKAHTHTFRLVEQVINCIFHVFDRHPLASGGRQAAVWPNRLPAKCCMQLLWHVVIVAFVALLTIRLHCLCLPTSHCLLHGVSPDSWL